MSEEKEMPEEKQEEFGCPQFKPGDKVIGIDLGTTNSCMAVIAVSYTHLRAHETDS